MRQSAPQYLFRRPLCEDQPSRGTPSHHSPHLLKPLPLLRRPVQQGRRPVVSIDHGDVDVFTVCILTWWKNNGTEMGAWAEAARIAFAMAPNSAGAECVFSMPKTLFGSNQDSALADFIQGAMMLHYNNTKRAAEGRKA